MLSYRKTLVTCFLIFSLLMYPLFAFAETDETPYSLQNSPEAMTVDLIAARPIGLVATIGGALIFVVSWPFSALGGNSAEAWNSLVVAPAKYTFQRPLGAYEQ
jgi:hypothetical protein